MMNISGRISVIEVLEYPNTTETCGERPWLILLIIFTYLNTCILKSIAKYNPQLTYFMSYCNSIIDRLKIM